MEEEKPTEKKKKINILSLLLFLVFLTSLVACGYLLYQEIQKELSIREMEADIQTYLKTPEPAVENETASLKESQFDWEGLLLESPYVVGWIQIPGVDRINYPIVQHPEDNQYFLTRDWKGNEQTAGAIFLNRYNSSDFTDMNSVIYGHRMKSGSMFGMLKYYEDQTFLEEHPYVYIFTPEGRQLTYEIVCCSHVKDGSDAYLLHFESPDERTAYYNMMLENAVTRRDVDLGSFDTTILLSTCGAAGSNYYARVVVLAKLVSIDVTSWPTQTETEE